MNIGSISRELLNTLLSKYSNTLHTTVFDCVDSTNTRLIALAQAGAPEGTVIAAAAQSAGRGRQGRSFFSPEGTGVYFSILLKPDTFASDSVFITTAAAVAVCEAIEKNTQLRAGIKWVNDVMCNGKKVCGILTQSSISDNGAVNSVILGIGINITEPPGGFPADIAEKAGALFGGDSPEYIRETLTADTLISLYGCYKSPDKKSFVNEYIRRSVLTGRTVTVLPHSGKSYTARVTGIDEQCRLLVNTEDGIDTVLFDGEVSLIL